MGSERNYIWNIHEEKDSFSFGWGMNCVLHSGQENALWPVWHRSSTVCVREWGKESSTFHMGRKNELQYYEQLGVRCHWSNTSAFGILLSLNAWWGDINITMTSTSPWHQHLRSFWFLTQVHIDLTLGRDAFTFLSKQNNDTSTNMSEGESRVTASQNDLVPLRQKKKKGNGSYLSSM